MEKKEKFPKMFQPLQNNDELPFHMKADTWKDLMEIFPLIYTKIPGKVDGEMHSVLLELTVMIRI